MRLDTHRDGLHAFAIARAWKEMSSGVDAAFSYADKLYMFKVGLAIENGLVLCRFSVSRVVVMTGKVGSGPLDGSQRDINGKTHTTLQKKNKKKSRTEPQN